MGDHTISPSDWRRQDPGLRIEEFALCKTHLLIIDGRTESVFIEVEPTVNTLSYFRGNKAHLCKAVPGLGETASVCFHTVKLTNCLRSVVSEKSPLADVSVLKVFATQVYFCFTSGTLHTDKIAKTYMTAQAFLFNLYRHNACLE